MPKCFVEFYTKDDRVAGTRSYVPHRLPHGVTEAKIARALPPEQEEDIWVIHGISSGLSEIIVLVSLQRLFKNQSELSYWLALTF